MRLEIAGEDDSVGITANIGVKLEVAGADDHDGVALIESYYQYYISLTTTA